MKHKLIFKTLFALMAMTCSASAAVTAPVGFVELEFAANADTPFTIPMNRPKVYAGKLNASATGNTVTIANNDLTVGAYNEGTLNGQTNRLFYILFTSGTMEGRSFDIVSNTANSVTVAQDGDQNLQALINDPFARDTFEIRPHWTLNTLFPDGKGIPKTTSFANIQSYVLFRPVMNTINVPTNREYIYFDSSNDAADGWYIPGLTGAGKQNDIVLTNQTFYVFRNNSSQAQTPKITGDVPTVKFTNSLRTNVIPIDNYKSISFPVELTLAESKLVESGVFKKTTSFTLKDGDTLQTYTYPSTGFNKPITTEYVYFDSSNDAADGWYIPGSTNLGKQDAVKVFKPGRAYIIRTTGDGRTDAEKKHWVTPLTYEPFKETTTP